jgi:hypothetical protein
MTYYTHISTAKGSPEHLASIQRFWIEEVAPLARTRPGFVASIDAVDALNEGLHHRIGVWERHQDLEDFAALPEHDTLNERFAELGLAHASRVEAVTYAVTVADPRARAESVTVSWSPIREGRVEEFVQRWQAEWRGLILRQPGLVGLNASIDEDNTFALELQFEDEAALKRFGASADHEQQLIPALESYLEPVTRRAKLRVI